MLPASGSLLLLLLLLFSKPNWNLLAERFLYAPACWLSPFCALTRSTPLRDFPFSLLLHFPPSHFFIWFLLPRTRIDIHLCAPAMLSIYFILFYSLSLSTLFRERERVSALLSRSISNNRFSNSHRIVILFLLPFLFSCGRPGRNIWLTPPSFLPPNQYTARTWLILQVCELSY